MKAGYDPDSCVEVYDSWYGLPHNPYKRDTDLVRREARDADLVIGNDDLTCLHDDDLILSQHCVMT